LGKEVAIVYDDTLLQYDFGPLHPLKSIRLKLAFELMKSMGLLGSSKVSIVEPTTAGVEQILLFHTLNYVNLVEKSSMTGRGLLDQGDTPAFKGCFEASKRYVGASVLASDLIMRGEVEHAFNPSGGLHHAYPARASGFCIFNDPAIVVSHLKKKYRVRKMLYLDVDAHHGDGVMYGFYSDPSLLDIDFHEDGRYLFPGTGFSHETGEGEARGLKVNIPLLPLTGDRSYLKAFHEIVPKLVRSFKPEVILMQCGADAHFDDRLANLRLSTKCYEKIVDIIHSLAHEVSNGRLLLLGGGGYSLSSVARCWTLAFAKIAETELEDEIPQNWRAFYERLSAEEAPDRLRDSTGRAEKEPNESHENVKQVLNELNATIPMLS
jgi:acetoin utilization protein AcuC